MSVVRLCRACWGACLLWSSAVWAAPEGGSAPTPSDPSPPTVPDVASPSPPLLSPPLSSAPPGTPPLPASSAEPTSADLEAAEAAFQRGMALADRGAFEAALVQFEKAYALSPANEVLFNIGAMSYGLERWARSRRAFELYLKLAGAELSPERAAKVRQVIAELSRRTATLRLMLNVTGASILVDGELVESNEVTGLILDPGEHVVRVSKPGFAPLEQVLRATHGESLQVVLPLAPSSADEARLPAGSPFAVTRAARVESTPFDDGSPALWVPWTITGVLTAGWMTTAALAIKARHDRDLIERPGTSAERIDDARRLHETLAIVSDVLLVSALASAGVSAYLTWWPRSDPNTPGSPSSHKLAADGVAVGVFARF